MVRFRSNTNRSRSGRDFSSRRERLRLLALFVPLALVILLMGRLRDPKTAAAINQFFSPAEEQNQSVKRPGSVKADSARPRSPAPFPGMRAEMLKTIQDNTYFRTAEKDAWFHFLELMQKQEATAAHGVEVEYAQLVDQPNIYRGTLVTVRGTARQITQEKPAENTLGFSSYYRVVVQPADGANWPVIVYAHELPPGVSPGDDLSLDVVVTGLFFKKLSYKWQDGLGIAPVILTKRLVAEDKRTAPGLQAVAPSGPTTDRDDDRKSVVTVEPAANSDSANGPATFQKILNLAGWDATRLAQFDQGGTLTPDQRVASLELLHRLRSISASDLDAWSNNDSLDMELANVDDVRGRLFRLSGLVTGVRQLKPAAADAERLEMPVYYECDFKASEVAGPVTIITARVPADWLRASDEHFHAAANVLFVKRLNDETPPRTLWLAKEIAWHPRLAGVATHGAIDPVVGNTSDPRFGKSLLGALQVDVGKFDQVVSRGPIRAQERDLFYETLDAVGRISPSALVRIANGNLPFIQRQWKQRLDDGQAPAQAPLAREVVRRAEHGRYSVALLFNDPEPQRGRLFVFDGVARRAVRVEVSRDLDGDIVRRHGIDHYYELEVFTDDSQNYPLIFVVREVPKDFPIGADIRVPVRVAGFFFKNWLYHARGRSQSEETADAEPSGSKAQFAPLLIGHSPIVLSTPQPVGHAGRFVLGGLFVLAIIGIGAAAAWVARDGCRFRQRTPAAKFELPPGQSLNDLNLAAAEVPMTNEVISPSAREPSS